MTAAGHTEHYESGRYTEDDHPTYTGYGPRKLPGCDTNLFLAPVRLDGHSIREHPLT